MRTLLVVTFVVAIQGLTKLAAAEQPPDIGGSLPSPICFPGVCLKKGMPQAEALRKLATTYHLVQLNESQALQPDTSTSEVTFIVRDKLDSGKMVGAVSFVGRRLSWASKAWGYTDDQKAAAVVAAAYSLIEHLIKERGATVSLETKHSRQGGLSVDQIKILFGGKEALLTILKDTKPNGDWTTAEVHVDEALREESDP